MRINVDDEIICLCMDVLIWQCLVCCYAIWWCDHH